MLPARLVRSRVRKTAVLAVLAGVLLSAAIFTYLGRGSSHARAAVERPDVPRVEGKHIVFSAQYAKRIGLTAELVKRVEVVPSIAVVGKVTFDPEHVTRIGTRLRGVIRKVLHFEGDRVKQGELLAEMDSPELGEAQASVMMLQAESQAARRNAARESDLASRQLTTLKEAEEASATEDKYAAQLSAARQKVSALAGRSDAVASRTLGAHGLTSPLSGTIVERHVSQGQLVEGNHTAFLVANLDRLWVELAVFERSLGGIRVGDPAELRPLGGTTPPIKGRVAHVSEVLDPTTRSATVRVEVDNRERLLRPGQAVDAVILASGTAVGAGLVVPSASVTYVDGRPRVFVLVSDNRVEVVEVELGSPMGTEQHIRRGLSPDQRVVVRGTFELKSELYR